MTILKQCVISLLKRIFTFCYEGLMGYCLGWLLQLIAGSTIVKALAACNITLSTNSIPTICLFFGIFSSFFIECPLEIYLVDAKDLTKEDLDRLK